MTWKTCLPIASLIFLAACSKPEEKKDEAPAPVQVTAVTQATIQRIVQGDGALFPVNQASIMSKLSAPVQKFYVKRGDRVKRGQLLAVLENRDLVYAAAESDEAVEQAETNLRTTQVSTVPDSVIKAQTDFENAREARESAKRVLESRQQLYKQGALAGRLVDEAQAAYIQADGQYRSAEIHLKATNAVRQDQYPGRGRPSESGQSAFRIARSAGGLFAHNKPYFRGCGRPSVECG